MKNITELDNGLIIITEKREFNNITMGVFVAAGLINETPETNGISHFLEHMAFKGTKTRTQHELSNMIENLGGRMNAYTSNDHTAYHVSVLPQHWKTGVEFLSDIIQNSIFPEEEIEKERNVILQEIKMYEDDPASVAFSNFNEITYKDQSFGRPILGPVENIKKFTKEDFIQYIQAGYKSNSIIFSICGNVNHDEVVAYVKSQFNQLMPGYTLPHQENTFVKGFKVVEKDIEQAHVVIGLKGPSITDSEKYTYSIFHNIFAGGMSCRLFQKVREEHGLAYAVQLWDDKIKDAGCFGIYAGVAEEDIEKVIIVCKDTLDTMRTDISDEDFMKAKNLAYYSLACRYDQCHNIMCSNAINMLHTGEIESFEDIKLKIKAITKQDIFDFAKKYITNDYNISIVRPISKG